MRRTQLLCTVLVVGLFGTVADAQNQIRNWEFDEPFVTGGGGDINTNWWLWESANFTGLSVVQGAALSGQNAMRVAIPPGASGSLQVYQSFMKLEQGVTYTISFMARADAPRTITARLQGRSTNNWTTFWSQSGIQLTTAPQTYTYQYQHTGPTVGSTTVFNDGIDFCFDHGGSDVDAYYDHIWMGVGTPPPAGVVVSAYGPMPADGTLYNETWATLGWTPGGTAASHDVYFGESFTDVNDGAAAAFQGNVTSTLFMVGLGLPGDPYPAGLVPGTTYYWRIDEVEANGTTKHKGSIWSFFIPPRTAYDPSPADGSSFVATNAKLSWSAALGAKLQTLYFGRSLADVNNGAPSTNKGPRPTMNYDPGPLTTETTYYWRVDSFDGAVMQRGKLWSFSTTRPGLGTAVAKRWNNISGTNLSDLKNDPRYPNNPDVVETVTAFAWNGTDADNYGGRIEGWVYVPATGDFTFWLNTDDQGELWLSTDDDPDNVRLIAVETTYRDLNSWGTGEEQSAPIPLVGGERYYMMALWKEGSGGDHCQVAWQGPGVPARVVIPGTFLSPYEPLSAYGANPSNGATNVQQAPVLKWKAGLQAASHELYFGTDPNAVKNATKTSPEYKGAKTLGAESYAPGTLAWQTAYYWRVDEVNNTNAKSPWVGKVWSFTTADFAVIDDFEGYTDNDKANEAIWQAWTDGFSTPTTNGAVVGNTLPPYAERTFVHGGRQAMPLSYDNATSARNSEAQLVLSYPRDWTAEGVTALSLWYYGEAGNTSERMYVSIANRTGAAVAVYNDAVNPATMPLWRRWVIPTQAFASQGINLRDVDRLVIGFGTKGSTTPGGKGKMYIDDIGLYRSASEPEEIFLEAEAANPLGASWRVYTDPLSSGGRHIGSQDGDGDDNSVAPGAAWIARYSFTAAGGTYKVLLRAQEQGSDSLWVRITTATSQTHEHPGQPGTGWVRFNELDAPSGWAWDEVHSNDHGNAVVNWTLPAGQNTLEIAKREDGVWLDAIVIMPAQ